jgi:hypothetical protein
MLSMSSLVSPPTPAGSVDKPHLSETTVYHVWWFEHIEPRQLGVTRPVLMCRGAAQLEYNLQLVDVILTLKEGPPLDHLGQNATYAPHIYSRAVRLGPEQQLRWAVPQSNHLLQARATAPVN